MSELDQFREVQDESLHPSYRLAALQYLEAGQVFLTDDEQTLLARLQHELYDKLVAAIEAEQAEIIENAQAHAPKTQQSLPFSE